MKHYAQLHFLTAIFLAASLAACGASRPVTYYNLTALPPASETEHEPPAGARRLSLGLGPISLPESLSRPQMALRMDDQRLRYDDLHRWSGSLSEDFAETLLEDILSRLPSGTTALVFPWQGHFSPSHRLTMTVIRFDGALGGQVTLKTRWSLTQGQTLVAARQSEFTVATAGPLYRDLVTAQSQAVAKLGKEIAQVIDHGQ
ncbi:MAG: PqiC family protein [Desulfobacteraceae bacterium]|nr:PqiC family protein [Desulfobacteraceae bacterium]